MITVVNNRDNSHGFYIGRGSSIGNPYVIGKDGDRNQVINKFRKYFYREVNRDEFLNHVNGSSDEIKTTIEYVLVDMFQQALQGDLKLVCFCVPLGCHGDIIKNFLDSKLEEYKK